MKKILIFLLGIIACFSGYSQYPGNEMIEMSKIQSGLKSKRVSSYDRSGKNRDFLVNIKDGEKAVLFDVKGAGIINHIWITIAPSPDLLSRNDIILRIYWDGNPYPSVESPIGPFFGQGWNEQYNYSSYPLAAGPVNGMGLVSYFSMPFAKGARIEIENQAGTSIGGFYFYVDYYEMEELPADLGRFHSWYNHELTKVEKGEGDANSDGKNNYVFADIKGKGHFAGINYYVNNPAPNWYGEGDDMWYIDGDTVPSINGTGTEDFFNTSWGPKEPFSHPYFGYPRLNNDIGWLGRTHVYRFFVNDPIYFEKSLKGTIEHGHNNDMVLDIATVAYWYQTEAVQLPSAPSKEMRKPRPVIKLPDIINWREAWRKSKGSDPKLWGNER